MSLNSCDLDKWERDKVIEQALRTLTAREEFVIRNRLGFDGHSTTYKSIAESLGVSIGRIRQIYKKGLYKLSKRSRYYRLSEFYPKSKTCETDYDIEIRCRNQHLKWNNQRYVMRAELNKKLDDETPEQKIDRQIFKKFNMFKNYFY